MERDHVEEYEYLYTYKSFFSWKQCSKCKKDFRREKIWRAITGPWHGGPGIGRELFLCMRCAPTIEQASDFFINNKFLPHKPPPPPSPPPKRLIREDVQISDKKKKRKGN